MRERFNACWRESKSLSLTTIRGWGRFISKIKYWWLHWVANRVHQRALEKYYAAEYISMSESVRRDRIARDIIKLHSGY